MMSLECFDIINLGNWVDSGINNLCKEVEKQLWKKKGNWDWSAWGGTRGILRLWFGAYERGLNRGMHGNSIIIKRKNKWG